MGASLLQQTLTKGRTLGRSKMIPEESLRWKKEQLAKRVAKKQVNFKILIMLNLKELKLWSKNLINWKRDIRR